MKKRNRILAAMTALCMCAGSLSFTEISVPSIQAEDIYENTSPVSEGERIPESGTVSDSSGEIIDTGTCGENLTWKLDTDGILTISGTGDMDNYNLSNAPWFESREKIKKVVITDGVINIGFRAFYFCSSLTSVTIPDSVTSIASEAFYNCSSLNSVTIPDSVTSMRESAFYGCSSLTSVTIPDSMTKIAPQVFCGCSSLISVIIPDSVTSIEYYAFLGTPWLKTKQEENPLVIVNNVVIDGTACEGKVIIPDGVTSIAACAFNDCSSLTSVTIPDGVTQIGVKTFYGCSNLEYVNLPDSITSISAGAPLSSIGAFAGCSNLRTIIIPPAVTKINIGAFANCPELNIVIRNPDCQIYDAAGTLSDVKWIIGYDDSTAQAYAEKYNVSFSTLSSGEYGYQNKMTWTLDKEGTLTVSGTGEMESLSSLKGNPLYSDSTPWYHARDRIKNVIIQEGITSVTANFYSALNSITIPGSVTSITSQIAPAATIYGYPGSAAQEYAEQNNITFSALDAEPVASGTCGENLTWKLDADGTLTISGTGTMTDFDLAGNVPWYQSREKIKKLVIENGVTTIGDRAFSHCSSLDSVSIPDSVTSIGEYAFQSCSSLTSVILPGSIKEIKSYAFSICKSLTAVDLPEGLEKIGDAAFWWCDKITQAVIPESVTSVGNSVFNDCESFASIIVSENNAYYASEDGVLFNKDKTELLAYPGAKSGAAYTVPEGTENIAAGAFENCKYLKSVSVPEGVVTIGEYAFFQCRYLTSVSLPDSVRYIGERAFFNCQRLESMIIPYGVTEIGTLTFNSCHRLVLQL